MKIAVIGGTGLVGTRLVRTLRHRGHDVVAASRSLGVNTLTGEGLHQTIAGARVVIDVTNSPTLDGESVMDFFGVSGRNLLAIEEAAHVKQHASTLRVEVLSPTSSLLHDAAPRPNPCTRAPRAPGARKILSLNK